VAGQGRRIAVLGDMLELGPAGGDLHRGLARAVTGNMIDLVFCCGPLMRSLWEALPSNRRGGYADNAAALESQVVAALRVGDVVMVKGSAGSRMKLIVTALDRRFAAQGARDGATA
jgi:UDP-N-acetylmuramoyl-tripeptide--D-alanyl-D-alanine ligase